MNSLTGTRALARLALRLDRVRLTVWVLGLAVMPMGTAANYLQLYPTEDDLRAVSGVLTNPSLVALSGPLFDLSIGGLTVWKVGLSEFILAALMSLLTVVRHTRTEEETGRVELIRATVVGRYAPLTAALLVTALANLAIAVFIALGLMATGLPVAGSVAFGLATGLDALPGVHDLQTHNGTVRFDVDTAALDAVLRHLTTVGVRSLTSQPPTLEEMFLRHYDGTSADGQDRTEVAR